MIDAREDLFLADGQRAAENSLFQNRKSARPGSIFRLQDRKEVPEKKAHLLIVSGRGGLLERDIVLVNEEHRRPAEVLCEAVENVRQKAESRKPGRTLIRGETARTQKKSTPEAFRSQCPSNEDFPRDNRTRSLHPQSLRRFCREHKKKTAP